MEWKKIFYANGKGKKAGVAVLISNKIDFKTKAVVRDKEGHYAIIKGTIQQEGITLVNTYTLNIGALKYTKQILMDKKGQIDSNTIIAGDFNTSFTLMDRSSRQKINKGTAALNDTLDQMDLIGIFRAFHSKAEYTFFTSIHQTFSNIYHMLEHKTSLNKFKKTEII